MVRIAVIAGTGFERAFSGKSENVVTPYGDHSPILIVNVNGLEIAFLSRHGLEHSIPPSSINYRANLWALRKLGVERIVATNAVGSLKHYIKPGDMAILTDFIDLTHSRQRTFYDKITYHTDFSVPYCPEVRESLMSACKDLGRHVRRRCVYVCMEGPRFETPAEISALRKLGGDVVGMTGVPEVVLARELGMCYASICLVTNMAAGMQEAIDHEQVSSIAKSAVPIISSILKETVFKIPYERRCPCSKVNPPLKKLGL